jgi:hypothetical protein
MHEFIVLSSSATAAALHSTMGGMLKSITVVKPAPPSGG